MSFEKIENSDNRIIIDLADGRSIDVMTSENPQLKSSVNQSNIVVIDSNNTINIRFENYEDIDKLLLNKGFNILIVGNNNSINLSRLNVGYHPDWGINGVNLIIGGFADNWSEPGINRSADNCHIDIGDNSMICGAMIYLQESDSKVSIGTNCMISWGVDIWCSDVHTITDMYENPTNRGKYIEIGDHVWIGKDSKVGKNVKIASNSIVGWGSIVTKSFQESNVILAGIPAKIIKRDINWNSRCINRYISSPHRR